jgi:hypothetical protein
MLIEGSHKTELGIYKHEFRAGESLSLCKLTIKLKK